MHVKDVRVLAVVFLRKSYLLHWACYMLGCKSHVNSDNAFKCVVYPLTFIFCVTIEDFAVTLYRVNYKVNVVVIIVFFPHCGL